MGGCGGAKFLAPPYYSQHAVFASLWVLFFIWIYILKMLTASSSQGYLWFEPSVEKSRHYYSVSQKPRHSDFLCYSNVDRFSNFFMCTFPKKKFMQTVCAVVSKWTVVSKGVAVKGVTVGGNAIARSTISAIWCSQASKNTFPCERTFPGPRYFYPWERKVLGHNELPGSQSEFGRHNGLTRNSGGPLQIERSPQIFTGVQWFLLFTLP